MLDMARRPAPDKIKTPLSRKATLVAVVIQQWTARKLDRAVTDEVNQKHQAAKDAGRYNKLLIEAERLKKINEMVTAARTLHYRLTKPWADEGPRVLPNVLFHKFADQFRVIKREFHEAADEFCRGYPSYVEERRKALGDLFKSDDYPDARTIRDKFKLEMTIMPFPDSEDFRSDLDDETAAEIKAEIEASVRSAGKAASSDTYKKIAEVVGKMSEKLAGYTGEREGSFKNTLVENVRELAELLPAFNLDNDPKLTKLTKRIERELCVEDAETLREDEDIRKTVQKSAADILAGVERFMS